MKSSSQKRFQNKDETQIFYKVYSSEPMTFQQAKNYQIGEELTVSKEKVIQDIQFNHACKEIRQSLRENEVLQGQLLEYALQLIKLEEDKQVSQKIDYGVLLQNVFAELKNVGSNDKDEFNETLHSILTTYVEDQLVDIEKADQLELEFRLN